MVFSAPINRSLSLYIILFATALLSAAALSGRASAHDPVFSPGPHVLFKNGVELHAIYTRNKQSLNAQDSLSLALKYGVTANWVVGVELPYMRQSSTLATASITGGLQDVILSSKYRFWRSDRRGVQESAAAFGKLKLNSGGQFSTGTTDALIGLAYGYESLKWYRWASMRYRFNQQLGGFQRGNKLFIDLAGGYRAKVNGYRELDTVWMLELNAEVTDGNSLSGVDLVNSGGEQWFVSPGAMWTLRNFAVKAGVQIPVISNLKGNQAKSKYRALIELEWHF
jgi:hypothetical protein